MRNVHSVLAKALLKRLMEEVLGWAGKGGCLAGLVSPLLGWITPVKLALDQSRPEGILQNLRSKVKRKSQLDQKKEGVNFMGFTGGAYP